ncbi:DUF86 domain-containing protein [Sulfurimonas sp. SAG-AH-194-C21]|nr:HepT-like ribonuclease domain-containing protein [Sulfurimonas sp. SAG-AH-194-C21]MDF1882384.1 DUF86 domain-containing protein [Sulfurimonas sp. SAG-AH-194-C21]
MSSERSIELFIIDIFIAIEKIKQYTKNIQSADDFLHDELRWDATMRNLEIIGEATNNLLKDEEFTKLSPKYFRQVVNFRNMISHGYFGISQEEVWDIVTEKLSTLEFDLKKVVLNNFNLEEAINEELPKQAIQEIQTYLQQLKREN